MKCFVLRMSEKITFHYSSTNVNQVKINSYMQHNVMYFFEKFCTSRYVYTQSFILFVIDQITRIFLWNMDIVMFLLDVHFTIIEYEFFN